MGYARWLIGDMAPVHSRLSLSAAQKIEILDSLQSKTKSRTEIIQEYGIGKSTIENILIRKTPNHGYKELFAWRGRVPYIRVRLYSQI